jgi:hypothetical protein
VDPAGTLATLLLAAGAGAQQIPPGMKARGTRWRDYLAGEKILLMLDDAAGQEQAGRCFPAPPGA